MMNAKWKYEYTTPDGNRIYKLWNRDNRQLSILRLRHYKDHLNEHVNWEIWNSPSFCTDEDEAAKMLQYKDCGIYGVNFLDCLNDAVKRPITISGPMFEEDNYELEEDRLEREEEFA